MNNKLLFSIIIPTYNSAKKLKRALNSISNQTFKDFEVIVCDDGSTDNTNQLVGTFQDQFDIKYFWQEHWGGPARPRNNGLKNARGRYIAFLDSDDWWYPRKLEITSEYLDDKVDILFHDLDVYTPLGKKIFKKVKGRHLKNPVFVDLMKNENALITSSVVLKKDILSSVGGFEEGFLTCVEDFDLWLKIARITEMFMYLPKSLGAYWIDNGSVSEASERVIERMKFVYDKHSRFLTEEDKKQSEIILSYLIGRMKQKTGLTKEALNFFKISFKSKNLNIKFRSLCWIVLLGIFGKLKI